MRLRRVLTLGVLLVLPAALITGQTRSSDQIEESLNALLEGALKIHISARIVDEDQKEEIWNMDLTRFTVSGRSVTIQLEGSNLRVVAEFTPYWESENELLLVAQGQTWIDTGSEEDQQEYRTSFTTLPIRLGEPILFLPLGSGQLPVDTERFGRLNIELEINVERYQS